MKGRGKAMQEKAISKQTLQRLPLYLSYLKTIDCKNSQQYISATGIADALGLNDVQVRKDLSMVSSRGRPKVGYIAKDLIEDIERYLGYNSQVEAIIVGVGNLGRALISYAGFKDYGLNIVAGFDSSESVCGMTVSGRKIYDMSKIGEICREMNVKIAIITVPSSYAQEVCNILVESGILAIWNFAPTLLKTPPGVLVQNENMASSLAVLSKHLAEKLSGEKEG